MHEIRAARQLPSARVEHCEQHCEQHCVKHRLVNVASWNITFDLLVLHLQFVCGCRLSL